MAGRGRSLTLPAWMTQSGADDGASAAAAAPAPGAASAKDYLAPLPSAAAGRGRGAPPMPTGPPPMGPPPTGQPLPPQMPMPMQMPPAAPPPLLGRAPPAGRGMSLLPAWMEKGAAASGQQQQQQQPAASAPQPAVSRPPAGTAGMMAPPMGMVPPFGRGMPPMGMLPKVSAPPPAAAATTRPDSPRAWTSHTTPEGKTYYHNKVTNKTTWEKPAELMSEADRKLKSSSWKEYSTPDGRKYFYNTETKVTQWTLPDELKPTGAAAAAAAAPAARASAAPAAASAPSAASAPAAAAASGESARRERSPSRSGDANATDNFRQMLKDLNVTPNWNWEQLVRVAGNDQRFFELSNVERRNLFTDYVSEKKREEREEQRQREKEARQKFFDMLREKGVTSDALYVPTLREVAADVRFNAVPEADRRSLFEEYLREAERAESDDERSKRRQRMDALREHFKAQPELSAATTWREVREQLAANEAFSTLEPLDQLRVWEDHATALQKADVAARRAERAGAYREERRNRDAFRAKLLRELEAGVWAYATKWHDYAAHIRESPEYRAMLGQPGSTARDLFEDEKDKMVAGIRESKAAVWKMFAESDFPLREDTELEAFLTYFRGHQLLERVPARDMPYMLEYVKRRDRERKAKLATQQQQAQQQQQQQQQQAQQQAQQQKQAPSQEQSHHAHSSHDDEEGALPPQQHSRERRPSGASDHASGSRLSKRAHSDR